MSAATLFLDIEYRPLRVESWQRAMADLCLGKIEVVEHSRDRTIRGVSRDYPMPSVVRILRRFKRDRIRVKFSRLNIYIRDGFTCAYCRRRFMTEDLTFDHVLPRCKGGKTCWENIVSCCIPCNSSKGDRTPEQAGMKLARRPTKPHNLPVVTVPFGGGPLPEEWRPYWTGSLDP